MEHAVGPDRQAGRHLDERRRPLGQVDPGRGGAAPLDRQPAGWREVGLAVGRDHQHAAVHLEGAAAHRHPVAPVPATHVREHLVEVAVGDDGAVAVGSQLQVPGGRRPGKAVLRPQQLPAAAVEAHHPQQVAAAVGRRVADERVEPPLAVACQPDGRKGRDEGRRWRDHHLIPDVPLKDVQHAAGQNVRGAVSGQHESGRNLVAGRIASQLPPGRAVVAQDHGQAGARRPRPRQDQERGAVVSDPQVEVERQMLAEPVLPEGLPARAGIHVRGGIGWRGGVGRGSVGGRSVDGGGVGRRSVGRGGVGRGRVDRDGVGQGGVGHGPVGGRRRWLLGGLRVGQRAGKRPPDADPGGLAAPVALLQAGARPILQGDR